jgi:hypothetical protein
MKKTKEVDDSLLNKIKQLDDLFIPPPEDLMPKSVFI